MAVHLSTVQERIERLSLERQAIWADPSSDASARVPQITAALADAYEDKRASFATAGTPEKKAQVVRRARIEHELERLIDSSTTKAARAAPVPA